jgi:hypothetical protein
MFHGHRKYRDEELWDRLLGDLPTFLAVGIVLVATTYFVVEEFRGKSRVNQDAIARCIQRGNSDAECERRVEEHAPLCQGLAKGGERYSEEIFDEKVFDRCIKLGKDAYLEQVAKESRERIKEDQKRQEKYGLPP